MTRSPRTRRTPVNLSESISRQLNMYAIAAGAAGVGMLALAQPAEGKIVYHQAHRVIGPNSKYKLDLNHDGITDFTLWAATFKTFDSRGGNIGIVIPAGNAARGYLRSTTFLGPFNLASALRAGTKVQGGQRFLDKSAEMALSFYTTVRTYVAIGPWLNVKNRYLGLRFVVDGQTHYGWARLNVNCKTHSECSGLLTGYAYETIPGKGIIAGATQSSDDTEKNMEQPNPAALTVPTPKPAMLGALAMGAPGLSIWRRKETSLDGQ